MKDLESKALKNLILKLKFLVSKVLTFKSTFYAEIKEAFNAFKDEPHSHTLGLIV